MLLLSLILLSITSAVAGGMPIKDNMLFAFDRCRSLSVDLKKGRFEERTERSFDLHCRKSSAEEKEFKCDVFETDSDKKLSQEIYRGGSDLGAGELTSQEGHKIKFLIGHKFASYESAAGNKVCAGIYLFEQEALKKKMQKAN